VCSPYTGIPRCRDTYQTLHSPRCATVAPAAPEEIPLLRTIPPVNTQQKAPVELVK